MKHILLTIVVNLFIGCAPVFSDLQDAKVVGKGNAEITSSFSKIYYGFEDDVQSHYGAQFAYGLTDKMDMRSRIEFINVPIGDNHAQLNMFSFGLKYNKLPNKLSFYIPVSIYKNFDCEDCSITNTIEPTVLITKPIKDYFDLNPSFKIIMPFIEDASSSYFAFNLGFGLNKNENWVIRPELGIIWQLGATVPFEQLSLGISYNFNSKNSN